MNKPKFNTPFTIPKQPPFMSSANEPNFQFAINKREIIINYSFTVLCVPEENLTNPTNLWTDYNNEEIDKYPRRIYFNNMYGDR